jgi:hypothetical protein
MLYELDVLNRPHFIKISQLYSNVPYHQWSKSPLLDMSIFDKLNNKPRSEAKKGCHIFYFLKYMQGVIQGAWFESNNFYCKRNE